MISPYPFGYQVITLVHLGRTDIENKQQLLGKFLDVFSTLAKHHRAHTSLQDGLRRLRTLFGVNPHHAKLLLTDTLQVQHLPVLTTLQGTSQQHRYPVGLARLGSTGNSRQVLSRKALHALQLKEILLFLHLAVHHDTVCVHVYQHVTD